MKAHLTRRTIRRYADRDVSEELLSRLLNEAARTQTMGNLQLYSVIVTRDPQMKQRLAPAHFNQPMVTQAPVVLTICADFNRTTQWCRNRKADPGYDNLLYVEPIDKFNDVIARSHDPNTMNPLVKLCRVIINGNDRFTRHERVFIHHTPDSMRPSLASTDYKRARPMFFRSPWRKHMLLASQDPEPHAGSTYEEDHDDHCAEVNAYWYPMPDHPQNNGFDQRAQPYGKNYSEHIVD